MARPNLSYLKNSVLLLVGLPCGILTGLTGMGASVVAQPLLRWLLGLRLPRLAATALAVTFVAALGSTLSYAQRGRVQWAAALVVLLGQTIGALLGQRLAVRAPRLLNLYWLWALLVVALGVLMCYDGRHMGAHLIPATLYPFPFTLLAAIVAGVLSAWTGLGGALIVPVLLFAGGLGPLAAQGTAIVTLLLASLPGTLAHGAKAEVEPQAGVWMGLGAALGGLVGAYWAVSGLLNAAQLVFVYGALLIGLGAWRVWRRGE